MKKNPKLLVLFYFTRTLILLIASAILALHGKAWLASWGIKIPDMVYPWIMYALVTVIFILTMPKLISALKKLNFDRSQKYFEKYINEAPSNSLASYRYPKRKVWIAIFAASAPSLALFFPGTEMKLAGYMAMSCIVLIPLIVAFHFFIYTVRMDNDGITIKGFMTSRILFSQIKAIELIRFRGTLHIDVALDDGKRYSIPGEIENFRNLVGTLNKYCHITTCLVP